jgi:hypothetical protein
MNIPAIPIPVRQERDRNIIISGHNSREIRYKPLYVALNNLSIFKTYLIFAS